MEGMKFPMATVDVVRKGKVLAKGSDHQFPADLQGSSFVCANLVGWSTASFRDLPQG